VRTSLLLLGWFLISLYSLVLSGCLRRSPYGVAERYVESLQQFNYAKCYSLLSAQDRADRPLRQFLTEIPLAPEVSPVWFRPILNIIRFELGKEFRNPDGVTAYVPVKIIAPNLALWERTLDANGQRDGSPSEIAQRSLATGTYPTVTYEDQIFLVKEDHHWRVKAAFAAHERALDRHRRAMRDFYEGRLDQVIAELHSIINELQQSQGTGNRGLVARLQTELAQMSKLKAETRAAAAYGAKLKLDKVAMRMAEERVPAIFGDVTNGGNRPIDELRLAVTWYQGRGKDLKVVQREEHSIIVTPIEFTNFSSQVIPFLPGEKSQFGFILDAPPETQQNATPYVSIASLAFTEIRAPLPKLVDASTSRAPHPADDPVRGRTTLGSASPVAAGSHADAPVFVISREGSTIKFYVKASIELRGTFDKWDASLTFASQDVTTGALRVTVQAASVDTGSSIKNNTLKSADFFNVEQQPLITFVSKRITQTGPNSFQVEGDFTIRGATNPEALTLTVSGKGTGSGLIAGTMVFDRKNYGMSSGIPFIKIADHVEVTIRLKARRVSGPPLVFKQ
jgi:polyisoprenoid-binding protein YceI